MKWIKGRSRKENPGLRANKIFTFNVYDDTLIQHTVVFIELTFEVLVKFLCTHALK